MSGTPGPGSFRAAVLVVSDRVSRGQAEDRSGKVAQRLLESWGGEVPHVEVVPDEVEAIQARLLHYADGDRLDLVVTSGGTGLAPRDVTPEATQAILERAAPGLSELLRRETARFTPFAALSRGVSGIRGKTLIVNLPGSPRGVEQCLNELHDLLPHAVRVLRGGDPGHAPAGPDA